MNSSHQPSPKPPKSKWRRILLACVSVSIAIVVLYARWEANRGLGTDYVKVFPSGKQGSSNLIVIVHGFRGTVESMEDVRRAVEDSRKDAEILVVDFPCARPSNADCFYIASNLCEKLNARYQTNRFTSLEFVGYSMGALLARKTFVYACGRTEDISTDVDTPAETRPAYEWATNGTVRRFVLLAGMNRGWTTQARPDGMSKWKQARLIAGKMFGHVTGTGRLILQGERGAPFVANLRLQWMEAIREMLPENKPRVFQLLGDIDDMVSEEDNRDASVARDFIWVQLAGTTHRDAPKFRTGLSADQLPYGLGREEKFKQALGDEPMVQKLIRASPRNAEGDDEEIVEAVIVLHGIRDYGEWTSQFEDELQKRFMETHSPNEKLCVYRPKYGYFPMGAFLLWPERQKKVRWFMDELTELHARYPRLKRLHFIGHSNGTYILASALRKYKALKIERAVFAGSVVPQRFDWTSPGLRNRVKKVRNYVGSADWVVAFFPRLFEIPPFTALRNDIGSAGFNGFTKPEHLSDNAWSELTNSFLIQTACVEGGHDAAVEADSDKIRSIAMFAIDGEREQPPLATVPRKPCYEWFSKHAEIVWLAIVVVLLGLAAVGHWAVRKASTRWPRIGSLHLRILGVSLATKATTLFLFAYFSTIFFVLTQF